MYYIILFCIAGGIVGYRFRHSRSLRRASHSASLTVSVMLFMLGLTIDGDKQLIANLPSLGGQALLIGGCAALGSAVMAAGVWRWLYKRKKAAA